MENETKILIVDDSKADQIRMKTNISRIKKDLSDTKIKLYIADDLDEAYRYLSSVASIDLILLDKNIKKDDGTEDDGLAAIDEINLLSPQSNILLITGNQQSSDQAKALRKNADFITKDQDDEVIREKIKSILRIRISKKKRFDIAVECSLPGSSPATNKINMQIPRLAKINESILVSGESGVGKTHLAQIIHSLSGRNGFHAIDLSAIPDTMIEGDLFGHEKGAFTNADDKRLGILSEANGGTLFIDEVQNLNLEVQKKLLRVIEEKKFRPLGSNREVQVDIRFIFASNRSLEKLVEKKLFREDLYFRISILNLNLPSISERREDIPSLLKAIFPKAKNSSKSKIQFSDIPDEWIQFIIDNPPVGNIRGLYRALVNLLTVCYDHENDKSDFSQWKKCIEVTSKSQKSRIANPSFPELLKMVDIKSKSFPGIDEAVYSFKKAIIQSALNDSRSIADAGKKLNLDYMKFYRLVKNHNLDPKELS